MALLLWSGHGTDRSEKARDLPRRRAGAQGVDRREAPPPLPAGGHGAGPRAGGGVRPDAAPSLLARGHAHRLGPSPARGGEGRPRPARDARDGHARRARDRGGGGGGRLDELRRLRPAAARRGVPGSPRPRALPGAGEQHGQGARMGRRPAGGSRARRGAAALPARPPRALPRRRGRRGRSDLRPRPVPGGARGGPRARSGAPAGAGLPHPRPGGGRHRQGHGGQGRPAPGAGVRVEPVHQDGGGGGARRRVRVALGRAGPGRRRFAQESCRCGTSAWSAPSRGPRPRASCTAGRGDSWPGRAGTRRRGPRGRRASALRVTAPHPPRKSS